MKKLSTAFAGAESWCLEIRTPVIEIVMYKVGVSFAVGALSPSTLTAARQNFYELF